MEKTLLKRLEEELNELTLSQRKVAAFVLANPTEVAFLTMEQLALRIKVSVATIMRLAYHFGYSGYSQLQKELQDNIRKQLEPHKQFARDISSIEESDLIPKYAEQHFCNIKKTVELLHPEDILKAAQMVFQSKKVYLIGYRSSAAIANYLEDRMARIGIDCEHMQGDTGRNQAVLSRLNEEGLVLGISFPRYANPTILMAQIAKAKGAKIIGITDSSQSPLAQLSDVSLHCTFDSMVFHNSLLSAFFIADLLLLEIARNYPDQVQVNLEKIEEVIKLVKANVY